MASGNFVVMVLYLTILILYIFSLKSSTAIQKFDPNSTHSVPQKIKQLGQFRFHFFTIWTFVLQIFFVSTAVLDETSQLLRFSLPIQKRLGRTRAFIFNTLVFPCSLLVVTIFWALWHIDRELVFPRELDTFFPLWLNHMLHTFILVPLAIELALPKKYSFVKFKDAALKLGVYLLVYQSLYFSVFLRYGVWLYNVYDILNWTQRILFTLFQLSLCLAYQKIGIAIQESKRLKQTNKTL